jgi:ribosomal protein S18 acetylase RimI-like enzyme
VLRKKDGKVVGFAIFSKKHLHFFAFDKSHIAQGLGSKMIRYLKKRISTLNVKPDNTKAIKFYKRHGFVIQQEVFSPLAGRRFKMVRGGYP